MTQTGFVRVSSNAGVLRGAVRPQEALALLAQIVALPGQVFWTDDISLVASKFVARERLIGHSQAGDARLLALALRRGGRLATFDQGARDVVPESVAPERPSA